MEEGLATYTIFPVGHLPPYTCTGAPVDAVVLEDNWQNAIDRTRTAIEKLIPGFMRKRFEKNIRNERPQFTVELTVEDYRLLASGLVGETHVFDITDNSIEYLKKKGSTRHWHTY